MTKKLTRKQARRLEMQGVYDKESQQLTVNFQTRSIQPKTRNQEKVFESYHNDKHLFLYGYAGTGKTFLSMYLSINDVLRGYYDKLYIVRSVVPTRDMGFLPGKQEDKTAVYESPYQQVCSNLFRRGDAYEILKKKDCVQFLPTSFIRGITLDDCIVLIDECQNMSDHELNSIITRLGDNSRLIVCGDVRQSDLIKEESGFKETLNIFKKMTCLDLIEFGINDIVRSGFVRDYIIAREELKDEKVQNGLSRISEAQESAQRWEKVLQSRGPGDSLPLSYYGIVQKISGGNQSLAQ